MDNFSLEYLAWAFALGALSAVSLPLGSLVGLTAKLRSITLALLAAFGAGALLAALSVELVAPTVAALGHSSDGTVHGDAYLNFAALLIGAILGGVAFVFLDQLVNAHGGFLRKAATQMTYFGTRERVRRKQLLEGAANFTVLRNVPLDHIDSVLSAVRPATFNDGEVLFQDGDRVPGVYFVRQGMVTLSRHGKPFAEASAGGVLGVLPLLSGSISPEIATAVGTVECYVLPSQDFEKLCALSPEFNEAIRSLANERLEQFQQVHIEHQKRIERWTKDASRFLRTGIEPPTMLQLHQAKKEHTSPSLAVWLGILLDGIPESLVIGSGFLALLLAKTTSGGTATFWDVIPYTLIAGLFLSNFPEALSSSASMSQQGWKKQAVFGLWFSLMVITGVGSVLGYVLGDVLSHYWLVFAEGCAVGAMLTMIVSTMIPEAVHSGNAPGVGLGTLAGFLAAVSFKLLE